MIEEKLTSNRRSKVTKSYRIRTCKFVQKPVNLFKELTDYARSTKTLLLHGKNPIQLSLHCKELILDKRSIDEWTEFTPGGGDGGSSPHDRAVEIASTAFWLDFYIKTIFLQEVFFSHQ